MPIAPSVPITAAAAQLRSPSTRLFPSASRSAASRNSSSYHFQVKPFHATVQEVFSYGAKGYEERRIYSQPLAGSTLEVEIPTHYTSVLKMKNGVLVNMNMSFDIWHSTLPRLELYGTEGTMTMPDPNMSDGRPSIFRKEQALAGCYGLPEDAKSYELPLRGQSVAAYTRGCGVVEMAQAIREGRKNRANEEMAIHIVEVINRIMESVETGQRCRVESECGRPELWDGAW